MSYLTIKDLPESERPYEKCEKFGPQILTDSELLAVILRTGSPNERVTELAYRIMSMDEDRYGISVLNHVTLKQLKKIRGIGRVKAIQLLAVAELSKRMSVDTKKDAIVFGNAESVAGFFMEKMRHLEKEQTRVVFLDTKYRMISEKVLFEGSISTALMEPREILREALLEDAVGIILLHNHPNFHLLSHSPTFLFSTNPHTSKIFFL